MTNKLRIKKMEAYISKLTNSDKTPEKHANNPLSYKLFLENELRIARIKLDELKSR